jgi:hypothetical protein
MAAQRPLKPLVLLYRTADSSQAIYHHEHPRPVRRSNHLSHF